MVDATQMCSPVYLKFIRAYQDLCREHGELISMTTLHDTYGGIGSRQTVWVKDPGGGPKRHMVMRHNKGQTDTAQETLDACIPSNRLSLAELLARDLPDQT